MTDGDETIGSQGAESSPEASPERISSTRDYADLALEVLKGKEFASFSVHQMKSIDLQKSPEVQVEKLQHLYGVSVILSAYLIQKGELSLPIKIKSFNSIGSTGLSPDQSAALEKLKAISSNKGAETSKFWKERVLEHLNEDARKMAAATAASVGILQGDDSPTPPEGYSDEEKNWFDKTVDFAKKHKKLFGYAALGGAIGFGAWALIKKFKKKKPTTTVSADGKDIHVTVDSGDKESTLDKVWKWGKRGVLSSVFILGGSFAAGKVLGIEAVQKWFKEHGMDVHGNRLAKALILFGDLEMLEAYTTLKKGALQPGETERYRRYKDEFGLETHVSMWVCEDVNMQEFLNHDYGDGYSIMMGSLLGSMPKFLKDFFNNKRQADDEKKLQARLKDHLDDIKAKVPDWQKKSLKELMDVWVLPRVGTTESEYIAGRMSEGDREKADKNRAKRVDKPSEEFDEALDSAEDGIITSAEKESLLDLIGTESIEGSMISDLAELQRDIPRVTMEWARRSSMMLFAAVSAVSDTAGGVAMDVFGPNLRNPDQPADIQAAQDWLAAEMAGRMEGPPMMIIEEMLDETKEFRRFITTIEADEPMSNTEKLKFEEFKEKFYGPDGFFRKVKEARDEANNLTVADTRNEYGEPVFDANGNVVWRWVDYTFFDMPIDCAFKIKDDGLSLDTAVGVGVSGTAWGGSLAWLYHFKKAPVRTLARTAAAPIVIPMKVRYWMMGRYIEGISEKISKGTLTVTEARQAREFATRIMSLGGQDKWYHGKSFDALRTDAEKLRILLADDVVQAGLIDDAVDQIDELIRAIDGTDDLTGFADELKRALDLDDSVDDVVEAFFRHADAADKRNIAEIIVAYRATQGGDRARGAFWARRLDSLKRFHQLRLERIVHVRRAHDALVGGFRTLSGLDDVDPDVVLHLAMRYPALNRCVDPATGVLDEDLFRTTFEQVSRSMSAQDETLDAAQVLQKAQLGLKVQRALLVLGVALDIFAIGMSIYRISELREIAKNASNPALKEIYNDKATREYINIALSGTSLVVSVSALALTNAAVATAVAGYLGVAASSLAAASTGVGIALIPIVLVAGGVMHVMERVDESRIEIANEKDEWKMLPASQLYRQWVTMVGLNDGEIVMTYTSWKAIAMAGLAGPTLGLSYPAGYFLWGADQVDERSKEFLTQKKLTRVEIVEALIEKNLNLYGDAATWGAADTEITQYAFQYVRAEVGTGFDVGGIEEAKSVIEDGVTYGRMMVARQQLAVRRAFFEDQNIGELCSGFSERQARLNPAQLAILPNQLRGSYQFLVNATPYVDLIKNDALLAEYADRLPGASRGQIDDLEAVNGALAVFKQGSREYLTEKMEREYPVIYENLSHYDDFEILRKYNEIQTVYAVTGKMSASASTLFPILKTYLDSRGIPMVFVYTHPASEVALEKWCADALSTHVMSADQIEENRDSLIRTDEEVVEEYGVARNKFYYALYKLATLVFGNAVSASEDSLKRLFGAGNKNTFGIYWNGNRWTVQEAGMESDNELPDTDNYDRLFKRLIKELRNHKDDVFEHTSDMWFICDIQNLDKGQSPSKQSEVVIEHMIKVLEGAASEFEKMSVTPESFAAEVKKYVKEKSADGHVVLPGHLIAKGLVAGVENLGHFSYTFEGGKVVCHRMSADASIAMPSVFGGEGEAFESFEVVDVAGSYEDEMLNHIDAIDQLSHAKGFDWDYWVDFLISFGEEDALEVKDSLDDFLAGKREEITRFVADIGSYPKDQQEAMLREKLSETAEMERLALLAVFTEAYKGGLISDDVDRDTVDESVKSAIANRSTFENHYALKDFWEELNKKVAGSVQESVEGNEHAGEYMHYFKQAVSYALIKSIVLKTMDDGELRIQTKKGLDKAEMNTNVGEVLMYDEWASKYKGETFEETPPVGDRAAFEKDILRAVV